MPTTAQGIQYPTTLSTRHLTLPFLAVVPPRPSCPSMTSSRPSPIASAVEPKRRQSSLYSHPSRFGQLLLVSVHPSAQPYSFKYLTSRCTSSKPQFHYCGKANATEGIHTPAVMVEAAKVVGQMVEAAKVVGQRNPDYSRSCQNRKGWCYNCLCSSYPSSSIRPCSKADATEGIHTLAVAAKPAGQAGRCSGYCTKCLSRICRRLGFAEATQWESLHSLAASIRTL